MKRKRTRLGLPKIDWPEVLRRLAEAGDEQAGLHAPKNAKPQATAFKACGIANNNTKTRL